MNFNYFPGLLLEQEHNCIYGRLVVDQKTKQRLKYLCKKNNIKLPEDFEFHCTVVYDESEKAFDYFNKIIMIMNLENPIVIPVNISASFDEVAYFGESKQHLVLKLNCNKAHEIWKEYNKPGRFKYNWENYIPHVQISYDNPDSSVKPEDLDEFKENLLIFDKFILEQEGKNPSGENIIQKAQLSEIIDIKSLFKIKGA